MNKFVKKGEEYLLNCLFHGLAHSYDVSTKKYVKPYPEVTGYIIKYFCDSYDNLPLKIIQAGNKLVLLQDKNTGGFASFSDKNILYAFDTSQILIGLSALYQKTKKIKYKNAAIKAGDFLLMMQLDNGAIVPMFNRKAKEKIINHDTYAIWNGPWSGLMCKCTEGFKSLYKITNETKYKDAEKLTANFYENSEYIECTHPLGYWLEGLCASEKNEKIKKVLESKVIPRISPNGYISYTPELPYAYVSGVIQLGIILWKMGYYDEAITIREYGRLVQSKHTSGGLFQYADVYGNIDKHIHTEINSWGTKYFCQLERLTNGE